MKGLTHGAPPPQLPAMRPYQLLAILPATALLGAPFVANRVEPRVFGLPFLLVWCVGAVLLTAATMAAIHRFARREIGRTPSE